MFQQSVYAIVQQKWSKRRVATEAEGCALGSLVNPCGWRSPMLVLICTQQS